MWCHRPGPKIVLFSDMSIARAKNHTMHSEDIRATVVQTKVCLQVCEITVYY